MGYLLPVQMDAYTQYANRTVSEKEGIKLDPVIRPHFYKLDSQLTWQEVHQNLKQPSFIKKKDASDDKKYDKLLAQLTGKGQLFQEYV
ncbi:hypothetical protein FIU87_07285 [Bacillus sp. THAF10]|uniref:hypothetical protein n=1 Tax=Bacillus sp. THAF10 TaxID=2587848 RepID=UPI0012684ED7|nr:hypothetical protein [Bacillus sp. THAF10]QFT88442.1 hypothetical protein FIU87_07285 [Bacillus sp. THAF10]